MHAATGGELRPKKSGSFSRSPEWGRDQFGNCFWGDSPLNAVVEHQRHQAGYPTSGVSTTPLKSRARYYATRGGEIAEGVLYLIDVARCDALGVVMYRVNELVPQPSIPEDEEVVLVASDFGPLPADVVVGIERCGT
jgi:hypothetical protein